MNVRLGFVTRIPHTTLARDHCRKHGAGDALEAVRRGLPPLCFVVVGLPGFVS